MGRKCGTFRTHSGIRNPQDPMTSRYAYNLKLPPTSYHQQGGSGKLYYFLEFKFLESDRPSSSPVELTGTMLNMKFCIEWCRDQGLLSLETSKFWGSGSWVSRVSPHIQILRSWVSKVLRLSKFWGPGFPESHGKKDVQGPRSIKVPDLGLSEPRISNLFGTLAQVWSNWEWFWTIRNLEQTWWVFDVFQFSPHWLIMGRSRNWADPRSVSNIKKNPRRTRYET